MLILILGLSLAFLFGCAHKPPGNCQELDWYELGRVDGSKGLQNAKPRQVKPICGDTDSSLSEAVYQNGYDASIAEFCSYHAGFELGSQQKAVVAENCPPMLRDEFQRGLDRGHRFSELQKDQKEAALRLADLNSSLSDKNLDVARRGLIHGKKIELEEQIKQMQNEIASLQKESELN
jgi:hypothetical protein